MCPHNRVYVQYIAATDTISKLREAIDLHLYSNALAQLQQRTWLLHWSLFIHWNMDDGCTQLLDLFMHDMFTVAMQVNSPHLLRCPPFCLHLPPAANLGSSHCVLVRTLSTLYACVAESMAVSSPLPCCPGTHGHSLSVTSQSNLFRIETYLRLLMMCAYVKICDAYTGHQQP